MNAVCSVSWSDIPHSMNSPIYTVHSPPILSSSPRHVLVVLGRPQLFPWFFPGFASWWLLSSSLCCGVSVLQVRSIAHCSHCWSATYPFQGDSEWAAFNGCPFSDYSGSFERFLCLGSAALGSTVGKMNSLWVPAICWLGILGPEDVILNQLLGAQEGR